MKPQAASARTAGRARFQQTKSHLFLRIAAAAMTVAALAALAACTVAPKPSSAAATPERDAMDKTLLSDDALRDAVVGYTFSSGMPGVNQLTEIFYPDGQYIRFQRVKLAGTYEIHGDLVCTTAEMVGTRCSHLLRDKAGKFYFRAVEADAKAVGDRLAQRRENQG